MPDDRKKMFSKKGTGTVPKTKHRNNTSQHLNQSGFHRNLSNNLDLNWERYDYSNSSRNLERNYLLNSYPMEPSLSDDHRQNGMAAGTANGTLSTSSTSDSNSRRDSVGTIPKCDNVKKCPGKKQIEDKLNQIREYLRVTTSLMSSIKNNEDQAAVKEREQFEKMIKDLKDSEAKLLALLDDPLINENAVEPNVEEENHNMDIAVSEHMQRFSQLLDIVACQQDKFNNIYNTNNEPSENGLDNVSEPSISGYQRNELEEKVEVTNRKVQLLREQQNALINLKRKAENQLRDARQAQENLLMIQEQQKAANEFRKIKMDEEFNEAQSNDKNVSESHFDMTIKELEDKLRSMRNDARRSTSSTQDSIQQDDYLQDQAESSNQILHLLDNQESQLNCEHMELQQKLNELHNKKMQIDNIAQQLQNLGADDDEDIGVQVRKIVTMKQQLSSLKDLLEIVKTSENSLFDPQNVNEIDTESQENAHGICTKTDNIRQDVRTNRNQNGNSVRPENNAARGANEIWHAEKESNKSLLKIQEREKVLAELKAKKRELEEIMYKQKDRTLINNDVCSETCFNKSESSSNNNMFDSGVMSWLPVQPNHNQIAYSSDECPEDDANEYSDINATTDIIIGNIPQPQPILSSSYSTPSFSKRRPGLEQRLDDNHRSDMIRHSSPRTSISEQFMPPISTVPSSFQRERTLSNSANESENSRAQLQKQLELIQNVCQSLLDQQASNNIQQLQNNLTPSPVYVEPRSYMPVNSRQGASLNVPNPPMDLPYLNVQPLNSQCFGELANNQNILAANTLQTQAFLLNTLNQCCQMLWFQQREIGALRNMICTWQDQMVNGQIEQDLNQGPPPPPTSYIYPPRPISSLSNFRASSQPRNTINPKTNQVSAACSMPNLNPSNPHANIDGAYVNQSNIRSSPSARLLESSLNNTAPVHSHHNLSGDQPANNTVLPSVNINAGINQPLPSQIWNGQALNNQVAPGNRANNYWDNFRSYSRQNLLSTSSKSNEGLQNATPSSSSVQERSNTITYDRSHSFSFPPLPKLNMVHNDSNNVSEESTPRRQLHFKTSQNLGSSNKPITAIPPDVLNINHNSIQKSNDQIGLVNEIPLDLNLPENNAQLDVNSTNDVHIFKDYSIGSHRNRNEWHESEQMENSPKSKLFEELRDNVYKEVATLISANENRPHFLIQLFRDLQHINSDQLRGRTLQSIQTVITTSLNTMENIRGANRQIELGTQKANSDQQVVQVDSEYFSLQPTVWPQSPVSTSRNSSNLDLENTDDSDIHNILKMIFTFLKSHNGDFLEQDQIDILKGIIVKAVPFSYVVANANSKERTIQKHFPYVLNDAFEKYKGRRISEIRTDLLKTISDVLLGEFSFLYIGQDVSENCENATTALPSAGTNLSLSDNVLTLNLQPQEVNKTADDGSTPQMQNGDLAEADQSRIELQEEEGAVGGVAALNVLSDTNTSPNNNSNELVDPGDVTDMPKIDFSVESEVEFSELGLDQVPTRLTTTTTANARSQSNTPNRDCSTSRTDPMEHF